VKFRRSAIVALILAAAVGAVVAGLHHREIRHAHSLHARLLEHSTVNGSERVSFDRLSGLPPPVFRYFKNVLDDGQPVICAATFQQSGVLRTGDSQAWLSFTAKESVVPTRGFVWNARVALPLYAHVRVLDSLVAGTGSGRISLMTALPLAEAVSVPQLDSGALHRYLGEAAWFPTALLPQSGVHWAPIDDSRAMATLSMDGSSVSLEFRFNEQNEIAAIYSPARWGAFDGGYEQRAWEGHFRGYRIIEGMRIPEYGEVGWYRGSELQLVWKGNIESARYTLCK
jgi:hypothetical protein